MDVIEAPSGLLRLNYSLTIAHFVKTYHLLLYAKLHNVVVGFSFSTCVYSILLVYTCCRFALRTLATQLAV